MPLTGNAITEKAQLYGVLANFGGARNDLANAISSLNTINAVHAKAACVALKLEIDEKMAVIQEMFNVLSEADSI